MSATAVAPIKGPAGMTKEEKPPPCGALMAKREGAAIGGTWDKENPKDERYCISAVRALKAAAWSTTAAV